MHAFEVAGESVELLSHRALFIPRYSTLVVADLHWGKSATFRARGVPLPAGVTQHDLDRLTEVLRKTAARRLIIVGDLLHAKAGRTAGTFQTIEHWREYHRELEVVLVRGNHDTRAGDPPAEWNILCVDGPLLVGGFALQHHPGQHDTHYVLAGHLHPHATVRGPARQALRLPCFAFGKRGAILPAFTSFTGGGAYEPVVGDRLFVIADGDVIATSGIGQ
ncbi:MAG: ligase-associated DNA damage response endonuclease PdeM [Gemmatimonadota bacterium]|nr:ligase-associated DNA damage response endonuclease PdeM [Gemmatimonadota bacterium]